MDVDIKWENTDYKICKLVSALGFPDKFVRQSREVFLMHLKVRSRNSKLCYSVYSGMCGGGRVIMLATPFTARPAQNETDRDRNFFVRGVVREMCAWKLRLIVTIFLIDKSLK